MKTFLLAAVATLAMTATAQAVPNTPPLTPTERFFECTTITPVGTIFDDTDAMSWSDTAPTASYQSGAGCGWADPGLTGLNQPNQFYDAVYGGLYKGEINQIELTLYSLVDTFGEKAIDVKVFVDGEEVFVGEGLTAATELAGQAAVKATFTLENLAIPSSTRDKYVVIAVANGYIDDVGAWVHGAKEIPAGVRLFDSDDLPPVEPEPVN